jgi:Domain of unknown function (DUF4190)/Septum formation
MTTPPAGPSDQPDPAWAPPPGGAGPTGGAGYPGGTGSTGYPGYPTGAPAGWAPPRYPPQPRSGSAMTSLVLGILGLLATFFGSILAIVFGIVALVRIRGTDTRGRSMALIGIVLGVMWLGLTVLLMAVLIHAAGYSNVGQLQAGRCFDNTTPGQITTRVHVLSSCTQPHNGQVIGTFMLSGTGWPGQSAVARQSSQGCGDMMASVFGQQALGPGIRTETYGPDQQTWSSGARAVSCVLIDPSGKHTGSLLGAG